MTAMVASARMPGTAFFAARQRATPSPQHSSDAGPYNCCNMAPFALIVINEEIIAIFPGGLAPVSD